MLSNCSNPYLTSAGQVFLFSLHDSSTEHHTLASQACLWLVGDTLHMAILIPFSVEELHQVFKQLRNPTTISNCFPNQELTPLLWKIEFGGLRYITGLSTDTQAVWPHFSHLCGNSPGSGFPRTNTPYCHPATGTAMTALAGKKHLLLIDYCY